MPKLRRSWSVGDISYTVTVEIDDVSGVLTAKPVITGTDNAQWNKNYSFEPGLVSYKSVMEIIDSYERRLREYAELAKNPPPPPKPIDPPPSRQMELHGWSKV